MPEIMIGRYAPLARPTLDGLRMEAAKDSRRADAIDKWFNGLKWASGCGGLGIKSIEMC